MPVSAGRLPAARVLVAAFWAGALWVLGYIAAPTVFGIVSGPLAGDIVGASCAARPGSASPARC